MDSAGHARPDRRRNGCLLALAALATLCLLLRVGGGRWASARLDRAGQAWSSAGASLDDLVAALPSHGPNEAAIRLEALAAPLGVDLTPRGGPQSSARVAGVDPHSVVRPWLNACLERPEAEFLPAPPEVSEALVDHAATLDAIADFLVGVTDAPRWEQRPEAAFAAPLPNLLGNLKLQRLLLATALLRAEAGAGADAERFLEAAWRLDASLRDRPELISQLVATANARFRSAALRRLPDVAPAWQERLEASDQREAMLDAWSFEAWGQLELARRGRLLSAGGGGTGRLWILIEQLVRPILQHVAATSLGARREALSRARSLPACSALDQVDVDLEASVPDWWPVGSVSLAEQVSRAEAADLQAELTLRVWRAQHLQAAGQDPSTEPDWTRARCPNARWTHEVDTQGTSRVALDGRGPKRPSHGRTTLLPWAHEWQTAPTRDEDESP